MDLFTANLVLQDTVERIFVKDLYADVHRGIFLVRGENVLLLGEIVSSKSTPVKSSESVIYDTRITHKPLSMFSARPCHIKANEDLV